MAVSPAPHERPSYASEAPSAHSAGVATATTTTTTTAPLPPPGAGSSSAQRNGNASPPAHSAGSSSPRHASTAKSSPPGGSRGLHGPPKIVVKKEPGSPTMSHSRPRPSRLDLSKNKNSSNGNNSGRPLTARDPMGIQEMGIHCLSPGFVTDDPQMKDHIQRSMSVREQQRLLIESRLHQQSAKGDGPSDRDKEPLSGFAARTPGMSRRNKAPPGLSIVAPSHKQFANERVIQSAPLGHSFTGRNNPAPYTRHFNNQPSHLSSTSHVHHVPANQTDNRLPPISDVFGQGLSTHHENPPQQLHPLGSARLPPASPGHPPPPMSARAREFKSAEEAQQELAGGRPELLPKLVHYGGHQPPTPPSPALGSRPSDSSRSNSNSKRRTRAEYEDGASPPLGHGPAFSRRGPFGAGRDSPETQRQKREEFLGLCERAWDLFHS